MKAQSAKQTLDLGFSVRGPYPDVISVLVRDARVLRVQFNVNAVAVTTWGEELASNGDRCRVRVLRIVDALGASESARRKLTYLGLVWHT